MKIRIITKLIALVLLSTCLKAEGNFPLTATNYDLKLSFDFKKETLKGSCSIQIFNQSDNVISEIPILLYRLMSAESITNSDGKNLNFSQNVTQFEYLPKLQVNYIVIEENILPGETKTINIEYSGFLLGYTETGRSYVTDRISPDFTIIRIDAYSYPVLSKPNGVMLITNVIKQSYNYTIEVTVPDNLVVANGGYLISKHRNADNHTTYIYKSKKPGFRIDIAIAPYKIINANGLDVFYISDEPDAILIAENGEKTMELFTKWYGPLNNQKTIAIIETEKGSGGQADETAILLPSEGFTGITNFRFLFHEISHLWNVRIREEEGLAPRWEEGLATFCEYLVDEKFNPEKIDLLKRATNGMIKRLKGNLERNNELMTTPMIDYGNKQLTTHSYTQPMIMFSVLYFWLGEDLFNKAIGEFYQKYSSSGATTKDFTDYFLKIADNNNLNKFFNDWVFTSDYTGLIISELEIDDIVNHYMSM